VALLPVHISAASQADAAARHSVVAGAKASGQPVLVPVQVSATSQAPAEARQTTVFDLNLGSQPTAPAQTSGASQSPSLSF